MFGGAGETVQEWGMKEFFGLEGVLFVFYNDVFIIFIEYIYCLDLQFCFVFFILASLAGIK